MSETLLIVDDEPSQLQTKYAIQNKLGYQVITAVSAAEALKWLSTGKQPQPDLILIDLMAPGVNGIEAIQQIRAHKPQLPIILLTQYGSESQAAQAINAGANNFLSKPVVLDQLKLAIQNALKIQRMGNTIAYLERKGAGHLCLSDVVGQSLPIKNALALAEKAATSKTPLWIEGESGTGKEHLARAIHGSSDRTGKSFVVVDCDRLPEDRAESLLFGQEKLPGKLHFVLGKFREAEQGTLFFRHADALPPILQHRLREALQEGGVTPIGSYATLPINVRIICSTSHDGAGRDGHSAFDSRLYQALRGLHISMPALRNRKEDIAPMAQHFLSLYTALENKFIYSLAEDAIQHLENNNWPGNLRQLANLMWRAVVLCNHDQLDAGNIRLIQQLDPVHYATQRKNGQTGTIPTLVDLQGNLKKLRSIEEEAIRFALKDAGGCMTRAARSLGIGRSTLYRRIHEMSPDGYISRANQTTRPMMNVSSSERS